MSLGSIDDTPSYTVRWSKDRKILPQITLSNYVDSFISWNKIYYVRGIESLTIMADNKVILTGFKFQVYYLVNGQYQIDFINFYPYTQIKYIENLLNNIKLKKDYLFQVNRSGNINDSIMYRYIAASDTIEVNPCQCWHFFSCPDTYKIKVTTELIQAFKDFLDIRKEGPVIKLT